MKIDLVVIGKLKKDHQYLSGGIEEYSKRLKAFASLKIHELPDETISPTRTTEQVMQGEAERVLGFLQTHQKDSSTLVIALSEKGQLLDSVALARAFNKRIHGEENPLNGRSPNPLINHMIIIVGGPLGLSQSVLSASHWTLSLSPLTFPHPMVRLIVLEQLYRVFKIQNNEPYHK